MKRKMTTILLAIDIAGHVGAATPPPGHLFTTGLCGGTQGGNALLEINPVTGARSILSDYGDSHQGPTVGLCGSSDARATWLPADVFGSASPSILAKQPYGGTDFAHRLDLIDPATGTRTPFSDFGDPAQGPAALGVADLLVLPAGTGGPRVLVATGDVQTSNSLLWLDGSGHRNVLATLSQVTPRDMAYWPGAGSASPSGGAVLVGASTWNYRWQVLKVSLGSGASTPLTELDNPAQGWIADPEYTAEIRGVVATPGGRIFIAVTEFRIGKYRNFALEVDPSTGYRTVISDFQNSGQGPGATDELTSMAWMPNGSLAAVVAHTWPEPSGIKYEGEIFAIDANTGQRKIISDGRNHEQGPGEAFMGLTIAQ